MRPRHAVLLTLSKPLCPNQLPSRQHIVRVSPLDATLMCYPVSVANKRLTVWLSPLDATLTKIRGGVSNSPARLSLQAGTHPSPAPYPLCFHTLAHSSTQRHWHNSFPVNQLRTLFIATEGVPLSPHLGSRHSTPIVTLYVQPSFLPTSLPRYLLTSFHLGALRAPLATLFPPWLANASANIFSPISTGAKRSRSLFASLRIPPFRSRATISTAGSQLVRVTGR